MTTEPQEKAKAASGKVRIRALTTISVGHAKNPRQLAAGDEAEVTEKEAEDFCKPYKKLHYAFGGERSVKDSPRHTFIRAERVG